MPTNISPQSLQSIMLYEEIHALIDVRERREFARGQIFGATHIPRGLLEFRIHQLVPVKDTILVLYDDDGRRALLAAHTLEEHGYSNVFCLEGGLNAWKEAGNQVVEGVNVPCKAFGERVAVREKLPQLPPEELKRWLDDDGAIVIEVRPPEEVLKSGSIPGSINIQGVELPIKIFDLAGNGKKIVVTCAGRTRGIIATQTLRLMGIERVYNLRNGIMGWTLAGFELEQEIPQGPTPSEQSRAAAEAFAARLASEKEIPFVSVKELHALRQKTLRETLYLFDVRTLNEYKAGHIPGAISVPGGQAIQCADDFVAIRRGPIVLVSGNHIRATITAFWFIQMGFPHVYVLEGGINAWTGFALPIEKGLLQPLPLGFEPASEKASKMDASTFQNTLKNDPNTTIIDVDNSRCFSSGHIPGAHWIPRSWLEERIREVVLKNDIHIVATCRDDIGSTLAAAALMELGYEQVYVLLGGKNAWREAGFAFESGLVGVVEEPEDIYQPPYERGRGDMMRYLEWEESLLNMPE